MSPDIEPYQEQSLMMLRKYGFRGQPEGRSMMDKWFSEIPQGAEQYKKIFPELQEILKVKVPQNVYNRSFKDSKLDNIGPAFCVECLDLHFVYPGTVIPRSFELTTANGRVWVGGNATKHIFEYAHSMKKHGVSPDLINIGVQQELQSLAAAVGQATKKWHKIQQNNYSRRMGDDGRCLI